MARSDRYPTWFEFERVIAPALAREQGVDARLEVDWLMVDQAVLGAALSVGWSLLEADRRTTGEHCGVLRTLRNAVVHNGGDLGLNNDTGSFTRVTTYLKQGAHLRLNPELQPYFGLDGTKAVLNRHLLFAVRCCLL